MHRNWHQSRPPHLLNLWVDLLARLLTITAVVMVVAVATITIAPLLGLQSPPSVGRSHTGGVVRPEKPAPRP